ncbi:long-chain fatty-acid--CoA ligase [Corynebacterium sanguinis]|uniref:long-chain fatty-acid--CoA ligase n=1 Tax=Corynebacterium sanguinis TaxID=2594913 RepID=UPI001186EA4A|nr:long-chain fatty-acid--CoA ligase [Corynebacterium sanguinis]MCT1412207.1 long-chain fatty-acid--CoA ligase [Corynebacterium sanguinis]MCT1445468.1 long-chain fatty-acid--CoA ligase [Corynebacterium sanguinis]MCT1598143.1 long-chain fatty-acid--CoA ligase [Corynebacterium sanguinis]QDR78428.1 long-chain fatty-acid--CoA ligase [Corynebacterium sanguinis]
MLSTMQEVPFSVARILTYGQTIHSTTRVTTWRSGEAEESSFAAIGARAAAFAHALHDDLGITGDERVATLLYNCAEHLEVMFAVASKGAVFTPVNIQLVEDQIAYVINHSEAQVIVADPRLADKLGRVLELCPLVTAVCFTGTEFPASLAAALPEGIDVHNYESLLDGRSTVYDWPELPENTAAALVYSTATTGAPKGVAYSHRSIWLEAMGLRATDSMAITHGETFLCGIPIYHVMSWGVPFAAFLVGTPLVLPDSDVSAPTLAALIAATHPRVAHGVPTLWIQLIIHYSSNPPERMSLTEIFVGGSPAPPALIKVWEERYGVDVIHVWGMTETSTVGTVARPPSGVSGEARYAFRVSQGRFAPWLEYRVVNDGKVMSSTDRSQGEIQVRGNMVAASYYRSPTQDAGEIAGEFRGEQVTDAREAFTADGWLRTGDVGTVTNDGFMTLYDRARDVIRSGGEWIYSAQVENLIMEADEVIECAVIGYPDPQWGERPLAITVLVPDAAPTAETAARLRKQLSKLLPRWMAPEYWTFVSSIDKTSVGKFDKKDLRKHLANDRFDIIALPGPGNRNPHA